MPRGGHARLTDKSVESLSRPAQGRRDKYDSLAPGLHVRVSSRGTKQWCLVGRLAGELHQRRYILGQFPHMGVEAARAAAQGYRAKLRAGIDPRADQQDRAALAIESQLESYLAAHARKLRSGAEIERIFRKHVLPSWRSRSVRDIGKADVSRLVRSIATGEGRKVEGEKGPFEPAPVMANRMLAYLRAFFRWLVSQNEIATDPTEGLKGGAKERARDRVLTDAELAEVWQAAEGEGYPFGAFVRALILTGQRRSEVAGMRWSEVDLGRAVWILPASRMKNGLEHRVPLSRPMVELLEAAPRFDGCDFVFAGEPRRETGRAVRNDTSEAATLMQALEDLHAGSISPQDANAIAAAHAKRSRRDRRGATGQSVEELMRPAIAGFSDGKESLDAAILAARRKADPKAGPMPHWTLHDLRRTFATGCAALRIPQEVTEAAIAHRSGKQSGVAGVYNVHRYEDEKRAALEAWARHVMAALGRGESNVILLEARG